MAAPTTVALWPDRYPFIALDTCIDLYEGAPAGEREAVRAALPCKECPENIRCLTAREKEMSSILFDREYRTEPRASTSSLFPFARIEPLLNDSLECSAGYRKPVGLEDRYAVCTGWDIAWSERTGGDYLAKVSAVLDRVTLKKRILDVSRWRGHTFLEQIKLMKSEYDNFGDDAVVVEDEGAQRIWIQVLAGKGTTDIEGLPTGVQAPDDPLSIIDLGGVPAIPHSAGEKRNFETGVPGMLLDIESGRWEIPWKRGYHFEMVQAFLTELEAFGWKDDKLEGVGEHDDLVMAWWHCWWGLERLRTPPKGSRKRRRKPVARGVEL